MAVLVVLRMRDMDLPRNTLVFSPRPPQRVPAENGTGVALASWDGEAVRRTSRTSSAVALSARRMRGAPAAILPFYGDSFELAFVLARLRRVAGMFGDSYDAECGPGFSPQIRAQPARTIGISRTTRHCDTIRNDRAFLLPMPEFVTGIVPARTLETS